MSRRVTKRTGQQLSSCQALILAPVSNSRSHLGLADARFLATFSNMSLKWQSKICLCYSCLYSHGALSHIPVNTFEMCTYLTFIDSHDFFHCAKIVANCEYYFLIPPWHFLMNGGRSVLRNSILRQI